MDTTHIGTTSLLFSLGALALGLAMIPLFAAVFLRAIQGRAFGSSASVPRGIWRAALVTSFLFLGLELTGVSTAITFVTSNNWCRDHVVNWELDSPLANTESISPSYKTSHQSHFNTTWNGPNLEPAWGGSAAGDLPPHQKSDRLGPRMIPRTIVSRDSEQRDSGKASRGSDFGFDLAVDEGRQIGNEVESDRYEQAVQGDEAEGIAARRVEQQLDRHTGPSIESGETSWFPWAASLLSIWFVVLFALGIRLLAAHLYWRRLGRIVPRSSPLLSRVDTIWRELQGRRRVRVIETSRVATPAAFGLLEPSIAIPPNFGNMLSPQQQEVVLAHELAHLSSCDPMWQAASDLLCVSLWWHPAVWWLRFRLREATEFAADESSLLVPDGPQILAAALVHLARNLSTDAPLVAVPISGRVRSTLGRRVMRLLSQSSTVDEPIRRRPRWIFSVAIVLMLVAATTCAAWGRPQANRFSERSDMKLLQNSWSRSIAAAVVMAVTSISGGQPAMANTAVFDDEGEREERERDDERKRDEDRERDERAREEHRERDERARDVRRDRERDVERRERDARRGDPRSDELRQHLAGLHERMELIEKTLKGELSPGNREEYEAAGNAVRSQIREIENHLKGLERRREEEGEGRSRDRRGLPGPPMAFGDRRIIEGGERGGIDEPRGGDRRREGSREMVLENAMRQLMELGHEEEAAHLRSLLRGDRRRPVERREPDRRREPEHDLASVVHELAEQVQRLHHELEEVRNHLRELHPDRERREERREVRESEDGREEVREREERRGRGR